jgi:UDP-3-O-[3-hydroxymyristoyl] N-acetylglucosamine deacetylase / 3-hydroxyacyl-[acyl-carrier-protein] dehydratase
VEKVQKVERATTIAEGGVNVHTVEHVLAALSGMGVDNAVVEMDANEPPIADGSALPFVELIKKAGWLSRLNFVACSRSASRSIRRRVMAAS